MHFPKGDIRESSLIFGKRNFILSAIRFRLNNRKSICHIDKMWGSSHLSGQDYT